MFTFHLNLLICLFVIYLWTPSVPQTTYLRKAGKLDRNKHCMFPEGVEGEQEKATG
jgi:hypothetical protein